MRIPVQGSYTATLGAVCVNLLLFYPAQADQRTVGPVAGLYGGFPTNHPFASLPYVTGPVTVEIHCKADLGCDAWDYTDCNTGSNLCDTPPTSKWVTVRVAGHTILGTDSFVGVPNLGDPPVPNDGHFFGGWNYENPTTPQYGFSDCSGQPQLTNIHRFTVTDTQWNAWLGGGSSIGVAVTSTAVMKDLPVYCSQDAAGTFCCGAGDPPGDCSHRPASNATVIITFTPAPTGSCCCMTTGRRRW